MRATISRAELFAFVRALGADPAPTRRIEIHPDRVEVATFKVNAQGGRYVEDGADEAATETTVIAIVGDGNAETVRMRHPNLDTEIDAPVSAAGHLAVAGWEAVSSLQGVPYVWGGGETAEPEEPNERPEPPAPDETTTPPRSRRKAKESD